MFELSLALELEPLEPLLLLLLLEELEPEFPLLYWVLDHEPLCLLVLFLPLTVTVAVTVTVVVLVPLAFFVVLLVWVPLMFTLVLLSALELQLPMIPLVMFLAHSLVTLPLLVVEPELESQDHVPELPVPVEFSSSEDSLAAEELPEPLELELELDLLEELLELVKLEALEDLEELEELDEDPLEELFLWVVPFRKVEVGETSK